ncbi:MAG: response regulator [Desulfobacterota bacterium]|nr:response regulator [Thermodesulfobacteriota bacterium]
MAFNILIVDDSRTIRSVIKKTLEIARIPVGELYEASNGEEGLGIMKKHWVDLVFADINMPVMTGIEMIEKMVQDDMLSKIPVVIISTEGSKTRIEELFKMGVRAYIRKPITPEILRTVVKDIMGEYNEI